MDLIVQITSRQALNTALEAGVGGVTVDLPRDVDQEWWAEIADWREAARGRGVAFYLQWDRLIREEELPQALETVANAATLRPDALVLRDPGLCREARERYPELALHAPQTCGYHNSPGLRLAEGLGYSRVALAGPVNLKDLALMRRQTSMPLEVVLPESCFGHLCLLDEYPQFGRSPYCNSFRRQQQPAAGLLAALELLAGLAQLGVAAVRLAWVFSQAKPLSRVIDLCQSLAEASAAERPRLLGVARDILAAFEAEFRLEFPAKEALLGEGLSGPAVAPERPGAGRTRPQPAPAPGRLWLEARDYAEAAYLAKGWRDPLLLQLNSENYTAFLGQYRRWHPRRLIWRLPPIIRESALPFFRQAVTTLKQGGFSRFVAGDWGAVALVREAGGSIFGEQTLGVRNSKALLAASGLGVSKVCLPPGTGPRDWQDLVQAAARGSFWSYLYHVPPLAVCPRGEEEPSFPNGGNLRWLTAGDLALLLPESAEHLESCRGWFEQKWVAPLVISLCHSILPWGQVPDLARPPRLEPRPRQERRPRPQPRGKAGYAPRPERQGRPEPPPRPKPRKRRQP
ncbi:MAG: U32 family peptidase [Deltaproteobacteria bacterium]|nr:U32 family peptidase [Deltaproteobacteria bacterium]